MSRKAGIMLSEIAFHNMPVILKNAGLDFCILDYEHGYFDYKDVATIIMTANLVDLEIIIRLADNQRKDIIKFMDMGARGLLLPMTNTESDIEKVVEYAKYPPLGKRGISTMRAHSLYNPKSLSEYMEEANKKTKVFAQIETLSGLDNLTEILNVNGIDGVFLGPNDLSSDMKCLIEKVSDKILNVVEVLKDKAKQYQKLSGIITSNDAYIEKAKAVGMEYFCVGSELSIIKQAVNNTVKYINE